MESVDAFLWSDRSPAMAEQFRAAIDAERQAEMANKSAQQQDMRLHRQAGAAKSDAPSSPFASATSHPLAAFVSFSGSDSVDDDRDRDRSDSLSGRSSRRTSFGSAPPSLLHRLNDYQLTFDLSSCATPGCDADNGPPLGACYEDLSRQPHWGMLVDLDDRTCDECTLSLVEQQKTSKATAAASFPPLIVFPCQHAYHQSCLTERTCTRCWEQQFEAEAAKRCC